MAAFAAPAVPASTSTMDDDQIAKDIDMLSGDLREDLRRYLDGLTAVGNFATMRKLDRIPDPHVRLLGEDLTTGQDISVPLGSQDALKLIDAAHQAPFGKGEETIVDTSVRNTWELGPERFSLSASWQPYVDVLMRAACNELGVKGDGIRAELYKMLLYEKGAMFKRHADSEKVPGMFGTLVISLPSAHWGGAVVVSHNGQKHTLQTCNHEYLAWYSDMIHEVQEVTSGYRWVLTYNLVQTDYERFNSAAGVDRKLRAILTQWNNTIQDGTSDAEMMIYQLDHKYTDASIRLSTLKGSDLLRAQRVYSLCDEFGFTLYLASLEKQIYGSAESNDHGYSGWGYDEDEESDGGFHAIEDVIEESLRLTRVVDTDGSLMALDLDIEEEDIVQPGPFEDRDSDEDDYEGWTGDAGATSTHWYRDSVLILVPNDMIVRVFLDNQFKSIYATRSDGKVLSVLRHLMKRVEAAPGFKGETLKRSVGLIGAQIANANAKHKKRVADRGAAYDAAVSYDYADATVSEVIVACVSVDQTDVLNELSTVFRDALTEDALLSLRELRQKYDLSLPTDRTELESIFGSVVLNHKSVSKRYDALSTLLGVEALVVQNQEHCMPEMREWVKGLLFKIFSDLDMLCNEDGDVIAKIAVLDTSGSLLRDRIIPSIRGQMQGMDSEKTTFMVTFLAKILQSSGSLAEDILSIYKPLAETMAAKLSLRKAEPLGPSAVSGGYGIGRAQQPGRRPARRPALDGRILANILSQCRDLELHDCVSALIDKVAEQTASMDPRDFEYTILVFLKGIIVRLREGKDQPDMYRTLFRTCLKHYVKRFVGQEPVQINWSRNPVRCNCVDCRDLNSFLRSPVDRVKRIRVSKARRHHLHIQLDAHTDCTHLTERGYAEVMVVTKQGTSFEEKFEAWKKRVALATAGLQFLEGHEASAGSESQLKKLLGEHYDGIMTLRDVRVMTATQQQPTRSARVAVASSSASNVAANRATAPGAGLSNPPQIIGQKRKAVVIDLTDE